MASAANNDEEIDYGPAATEALKAMAWQYWGDIWRSLYYYIPMNECAAEFKMQKRDDRQSAVGIVSRKSISPLEGILVDEAFDAPFNTYAVAGIVALVSWRFLRAYPPLANRPATVFTTAFVPPALFCIWRRSYMRRGMICQFKTDGHGDRVSFGAVKLSEILRAFPQRSFAPSLGPGQNSPRAQEIIDLYREWCPDDYEFMKGRPGMRSAPGLQSFPNDVAATLLNCRSLFTCYAKGKLESQFSKPRLDNFDEFDSNIILKDSGTPIFVGMFAALVYPLLLRQALRWPAIKRLPPPAPLVICAIPSISILYVSMLHHFRGVIREIVNFDGPLSSQDEIVKDMYKAMSPADFEALREKALIDCCRELKWPEGKPTGRDEHSGECLTMYESDMLRSGSPLTLGLIAALSYPITWRSVSRLPLFRNRPILPQFLAIVPPVSFLYVAGVYNCRVIMSRFVRDEGERSDRARAVIERYRKEAPTDYDALRKGSGR
ncbi:hypothetical protein FOL47_003360 [Perkinsus chesapeaki]|uniref:Uncharacterized protein n=1 Tax=Perkinsus chesapeaki TaxID=330153 RepID=A0A7J6M8L9_PERCH|nr:hypothetical protein FOL47_003360 [Perkinsus chesapeaki]